MMKKRTLGSSLKSIVILKSKTKGRLGFWFNNLIRSVAISGYVLVIAMTLQRIMKNLVGILDQIDNFSGEDMHWSFVDYRI